MLPTCVANRLMSPWANPLCAHRARLSEPIKLLREMLVACCATLTAQLSERFSTAQ